MRRTAEAFPHGKTRTWRVYKYLYMSKCRLIAFDWALKKLLHGKANFGIFEGFLSELLRDNFRILESLGVGRHGPA